jgi:hypothetical protein
MKMGVCAIRCFQAGLVVILLLGCAPKSDPNDPPVYVGQDSGVFHYLKTCSKLTGEAHMYHESRTLAQGYKSCPACSGSRDNQAKEDFKEKVRALVGGIPHGITPSRAQQIMGEAGVKREPGGAFTDFTIYHWTGPKGTQIDAWFGLGRLARVDDFGLGVVPTDGPSPAELSAQIPLDMPVNMPMPEEPADEVETQPVPQETSTDEYDSSGYLK